MKRQELLSLLMELEELRIQKTLIPDRIARARAAGDLSSNLEYQNAKVEEERIYNRMAEIEQIISDAERGI